MPHRHSAILRLDLFIDNWLVLDAFNSLIPRQFLVGGNEPGNEAKHSPPKNDSLQISANWILEVENCTKSYVSITIVQSYTTSLLPSVLLPSGK